MAGKTISQFIRLEGGEEIRRLLSQIGQVGEQAFAQIQAAVSPATKALETVSAAVKNVEKAVASVANSGKQFGAALGEVGNAGRDLGSAVSTMAFRIAAGLGVAGGAFVALAKSSADSADEIIKNAQAAGLSVERYQELRFAAAQSGLDMEQFGRGITAFSKQVVEAAKNEAQAFLGFVDQVKQAKVEPGVFRVDPTRDFAKEFEVISAAAQKLQNDLKSVGIEQPLFRIRQELQKLADGGADARKKFEELTGMALPSLSAGLDSLRQIAQGGGDALKQLGVRTTEIVDGILRVRDTDAVLLDVAEAFSKLADGPRKVAISTDLLSKLGPKWAAFLNAGRDGINALTKDFKNSGLALTREQTRIGEAMNDAISRMGTFAKAVKDQLGLLFAPTITQAADALSKAILDNSKAIIAFGESLRDRAIPYVTAFFNLLRGFDDGSDAAGHLIKMRDGAIEFGQAVQGAFTNIILPAFGALLKILDAVASGINAVFGTSLTGGQIGIAIVVAQLIGAFKVLTAGIWLAVAAARAFFFTPVGALIAALGLIIIYWDDIKKVAQSAWDTIKGGAQEAWDVISKFFSKGEVDDRVWAWISSGLAKEWENVKNLVANEIKALKDYLGIQEGDDLWTWLTRSLSNELERIKRDVQATIGFIERLIEKIRSLPKVPENSSAIPSEQVGGAAGVPLVGGQSRFDRLPQSQNIEDRRGEASGQLQQLEQEGQTMLQRLAEFAQQVGEQVTVALNAMVEGARQSAQAFVDAFTGAGDLIGQLLASSVQRAADGISGVIDGIGQAVRAALDSLVSAIATVSDQVNSMIQQVISALEAAVQRARELAEAARQASAEANAGGGGGPGFALGGYTGAGRTRIAGVVHGEEYVQPARVVARPGVLAFMELLRRSGGDLQSTIARFARGFADGGFVNGLRDGLTAFPVPGFATGGFVPSPASMPHFGTLDLTTDSGTRRVTVVMNDALRQVQQDNIRRQMARIGKPARGI